MKCLSRFFPIIGKGLKSKILVTVAQYEEVENVGLRKRGGYSEYRCFNCGLDLRRVAFTCKSCFCLSRFNGSLLSALMRSGHECLEEVVSLAKKHNLKIGTIVVVQTHGRSGQFNPHLHVIMTSGGIDQDEGKWEDSGYFPYGIIHKKWEYHLFGMMKKEVKTAEMKNLIDELCQKYPNGLVANVSKGYVPERFKGLAKYLAKYLASPSISVRRIISYTGKA